LNNERPNKAIGAKSGRTALGERLSTCPLILVIQKAFLQRFTSYELLSVIKLAGFFVIFFAESDFLQ